MKTLTRRTWLGWTGAVALGSLAPTVLAASKAQARARAQAKRNLKLGVFTGVYAGLPVEQAAQRIRDDGFGAVVLEFAFADVRFDPWAPDWAAARKITECLTRHGLRTVGLFGYYNVLDPNDKRRRHGERRMELLIEKWREFGCPLISTETGTLNAQSEWLESPDNTTETAFVQCREAFAELAEKAERTGAVISIEPYLRNVIDSVARAERLLAEIKSPRLKLVMDPCNYFRKEELSRMEPMLKEMFRRLGKQIVLAHAKDVKAAADGTDLPAAGKGVLDYQLYLRLLADLNREVCLVIEHLTLDDVGRARDYVLSQFERL